VLKLWRGLSIGPPALRDSSLSRQGYAKNGSFTSGISKMSCVCVHNSTVGDIYGAMGELHQLGEVSLVPSGGQPAKPQGWQAGWSGHHQLSPPPWPSTPRVDTCSRSRGPNRHKTWPPGQGDWSAGPGVLSAWGLAHSLHVSNTPPW
jgi:hypothetical protein